MIAHLCRLAWNRRRRYVLLVAELLLAFLVLTPLTAGWVLFVSEQLRPLGFEHENVWSVRLTERGLLGADDLRNIELVGRELRAVDGVQAVALASRRPSASPTTGTGSTPSTCRTRAWKCLDRVCSPDAGSGPRTRPSTGPRR